MFRNIAGLLMPVCIFCSLPEPRFACANALGFAVRDTSPVTPLHLLNLPRRHVSSYFDVDGKERDAMHQLLDQVRRGIVAQDLTVAGFNIGINVAEAAGQTLFHYHIHLIPRRQGDVASPRGRVRAVIPEKQSYSPKAIDDQGSPRPPRSR
jgi:diadenosine tetraphosphate (Ap4A) HIT family hydrolase